MKTLWIAPLALSAVLWLEMAFWSWRRARPAGRMASALFASVALYVGAYAFGLLLPPTRTDVLWATTAVEYLGLSFLPFFLLRAVLRFTGREGWVDPLHGRLMLGLSIALAALKAFDFRLGLIYRDLTAVAWHGMTVARFEPGPAYWVLAAYQQVALLGSLAALVGAWRTSVGPFRRQLSLLASACAIPALGHLAYSLGRIPVPLDPNPFFLFLSLAFTARAAFRHDFLVLAPLARQTLIDQFDEAVLVWDPRLRLVDLNEAARDRLRLDAAALGRPAAEVLRGWPEIPEPGRAPPGTPAEILVNRRETPMWWAARWIALTRRGRRLGWMLVIRDDTDRRRAEEERVALERRILRMQKAESLGVLAGGIAHEFNNLLMAVLGNLEILRARRAEEELDEAEKAAARAAELSQMMLDYTGQGRRQAEPFDLNALVEEGVRRFSAGRPPGIRIEADPDAECPPVEGDRGQIAKVIEQLAANAAEAIGDRPEGRITISTGVARVGREHGASPDPDPLLAPGEYAVFTVRDNGSGIEAECLPRIFDPFFSTRFTGRGLGLASVQGIVSGHGGAIRVRSAPGRGSVFRVYLPAARRAGSAEGRP